jgi:integrase/recombinase XerD
MKLSKALEGYKLARLSEGYSQETISRYHYCLTQVFDFLGDKDIYQVSSDDLQHFFLWLRNEYMPNRPNGDNSPLASASIYASWKAIRSFYNWGEQELKLARPDNKLKPPRYSSAVIQPYSQSEIKKLIKGCKFTKKAITNSRKSYYQARATGPRNIAIVLTLLDTGLRASELSRLKHLDLDLRTGGIRVKPFGAGIKSSGREVFVGKSSRAAIWKYIALSSDKDAQPLFQTIKQRSMNRHSLRSMLRRLGLRAGVNKTHAHRFRHTFAIQYLRNGGDVFSLQRLLGHSTLAMVNRYLAIARTDIAEAHKRASPVDGWNI